MKKLFLLLSALVIFAISAFADSDVVNVAIDDITINLPRDCTLNQDLSEPDNGAFCYSTPSKDFMLIFMYFPYDESFSARDRLIGEAEQLGFELTGDGDILNMSLGQGKMLEFSATPNMGIGISFFYPEEQIGLYFCVISTEPDFEAVFDTLASIRAK